MNGYAYASNPGLLSIIRVEGNKNPELIFNKESYLYEIVNNNSSPMIIKLSDVDKHRFSYQKNLKVYEFSNGWLYKKSKE